MQGSIKRENGVLYLEEIGPAHTSVRYELKDVLYSKRSPYQLVEIAESYDYGRMLILDGCVNVCERDEANYHEMIAHIPALLHPESTKVLVIGGGDGGTVRELLKHDSIEHIDLVEIDVHVIESCKRYFPSLASSLDNPRVRVHTGDGVAFVHNARSSHYSIIIIDSSDPVGPAEGLFTYDFYKACHRIVDDNGIVVAQSESPYVLPDVLKEVHTLFCRIFPTVLPYRIPVPTYPSGQIYMMMGTKQEIFSLRDHDQEVRDFLLRNDKVLRYLNEQILNSTFAIPGDVKRMLVGDF